MSVTAPAAVLSNPPRPQAVDLRTLRESRPLYCCEIDEQDAVKAQGVKILREAYGCVVPRERLNALLDAVEQAADAWQPIATAPKDGTPVLLAGGADDGADDAPAHVVHLYRAPCRAVWSRGSWRVVLADSAGGGVTRHNPTHWMNLPNPPHA